METFRIESVKGPTGENDLEVEIKCNDKMLIAGLTQAILHINDALGPVYTVRNGFWLMLNSEVCAALDRRTKKK